MSDAAMKVDPEFCTRSGSMGRVGGGGGGGGGSAAGLMGSGEGRGGMHSGLSNSGGFSAPSPPDYIVRQHSFLGFYLSLNPGDEGTSMYFIPPRIVDRNSAVICDNSCVYLLAPARR